MRREDDDDPSCRRAARSFSTLVWMARFAATRRRWRSRAGRRGVEGRRRRSWGRAGEGGGEAGGGRGLRRSLGRAGEGGGVAAE